MRNDHPVRNRFFYPRWKLLVIAALFAVGVFSLGSCLFTGGGDEATFSQFPGMEEAIAILEQTDQAPNSAERRALERYRPRVWLVRASHHLLIFYRDYIAHGSLFGKGGKLISAAVTPELLNQDKHRLNPGLLFEHDDGASFTPRSVLYGRIDRGSLEIKGHRRKLVFLTYNLAFRHSGILAGLSWAAELGLGIIGDLRNWHQLDHYVALTLTFLANAEGLPGVPLAATFQQHNYARTYRLGGAPGAGRLIMPEDGRIVVDVAVRTNELYPHRPGRVRRRAVGFMTPETVKFLITGKNPPFRGGYDVTDPHRLLADLPLETLSPADAFYVFRGWLGERRFMPGRDGPPGANYATLPAFLPWQKRVFAQYWHEESLDYPVQIRRIFTLRRQGEIDISSFVAGFIRDWGEDDFPI